MENQETSNSLWRLAPLMASVLAACTGNVLSQDTPHGNGQGGDNGGTAPVAGKAGGTGGSTMTGGHGPGSSPGTNTPSLTSPGLPESAGVMPLRRLTRDQYNLSVAELLGDSTNPALALAADPKAGYGFYEPGLVSEDDVRAYQGVAETVAASAIKRLTDATKCTGTTEDLCFQKFYEDFGRRAFRRPLNDDERALFKTLYSTSRNTLKYDYPNTVRLAIQAILQSPNFLYRWELGPSKPALQDGLVKLTSFEVAARLSYFLWNTMPDAMLAAAADANQIQTATDVEKQARRMLGDARAKNTIETFHQQWLDIEKVTDVPKDATIYPKYNLELAQAMRDETKAFVDQLILGDGADGKLDTLLAGPISFVNGPLATLYGVPGVTGSAFRRVNNVPHRFGLLTQASYLSSHAFAYDSHPILRGVTLYRRVLCGQIERPAFPIPDPKPLTDGVTNRRRFTEHSTDPQCAGCHRLFDPLGFALENYDGVGAYRTTQVGQPIDATGTLALPNGDQKPFANGEEMVHILANSDDVRQCMSLQWSRYVLGRLEGPEDMPSLANAYKTFQTANYDVRELIVALVKSKTFLFRKAAPQELTQ